MSSVTDKDGGPTFPQTIDDMGTLTSVTKGMSLRAYFAGQALTGIWANPEIVMKNAEMAICVVECADALIAELEKEKSDAAG